MVFESVVADVLNRFLGDYVQDLDGSQLKLGIWGGDVVLKNLHLKESVLRDLDLPIRTVAGYLGQLVLKIPWKQVYTAPTVVLIERLYLLAVPCQDVAYNREKEETAARDLKRQEIHRYEQLQQIEKTKNALKKQKDDTFTEKLITQIIKNVQITVRGIHIRYEDQETTVQKMPFALGFTLHELTVESTDNHWRPAIVTDAVRQIYKVVKLDSMSIYWNSRTVLYSQMTAEERDKQFLSDIATSTKVPPDMSYVLGPINAHAQLKLNPKPEQDGSSYRIPKVWLNLVLEKLDIGMSKFQYRDVIELMQSMERMALAQPFRKYRPHVSQYTGNFRQWWLFAYKCVLNETVRRRRRNWAWVHMKHYRQMCRRYAKAYLTKLTTKKPPADVLARIEDYEYKLDIVNVIMIRQKVQREAEKITERQKLEAKSSSWLSGWFTRGNAVDVSSDVDLAKQLEAAMTPEERQRLYDAIDYQENAVPTVYPTEFEAVHVHFRLNRLDMMVTDDEAKIAQVMVLTLHRVDVSFVQRPAAAAIRLDASINELGVDGRPNRRGEVPAIAITRPQDAESTLLSFMFETNPLDGDCDHRVRLRSQPLEMVFHAETFNQLGIVFKPPKHIKLSQLQAAAMNKLQELKETSALRMQYAIETHKRLELEVDLLASQLVVPEYGDANRHGRMLAVNLGNMRVRSTPRKMKSLSVKKMSLAGTSADDIFRIISEETYDIFSIELEDIEVVLAVQGESWKEALRLSGSPQHLVRPISLSVALKKCLITDDPRLPVVKVDAAIPKLSVSVSDFRLIQLAILINSIPGPAVDPNDEPVLPALDNNANVLTPERSQLVVGSAEDAKAEEKSVDEQITDLLVSFTIKELVVDVFRRDSLTRRGDPDPMVSVMLGSIGCGVTVRTHSIVFTSSLAGVSIKSHEFGDPDGADLFLVSTPMTRGSSKPLFTFKYTKVDRSWERFMEETGGVLQLVELSMSELTLQLHQAALCSLMTFADAVKRQLVDVTPPSLPPAAAAAVAATQAAEAAGKLTRHQTGGGARGASVPVRRDDIIDLKLVARFSDFRVQLSSTLGWLAEAELGDLQLGAQQRRGVLCVTAGLSQLALQDLTLDARHRQILSMTSDEVFRAEVNLYERIGKMDPDALDMELSAQLGGARLVFINRFVRDLVAFSTPFSRTQQALASASHNAAEAAHLAMQNAVAQTFRVKLDVVMKAPVIVVPQSSDSDWALVVDLGTLSVKNELELGPLNERLMPAVMDTMTLQLDNLKFSRMCMGKDGGVLGECEMLRPVTLSVLVTRNLTASWYHEKPALDLRATLGSIVVVLSEDDYAQIMATLADNLAEPGTPGLDVLPEVPMEAEPTEAAPPTTPAAARTQVAAPASQADAGPVYEQMLFGFQWAFVGIELLNSPASHKQWEPGTDCRRDCTALASLGVHELAVTGRVLSDGAMSVAVSVKDCVLEDTRPAMPTVFPRLMEKVGRSGKPSSGMVSVSFDQNADQDRTLEARVSSVSLILYLPYLLLLTEFFTKNLPQAAPQRKRRPRAGPGRTAVGKPMRPTTLSTAPTPAAPAAAAPVAAPAAAAKADGGRMVIRLKVDRPDIALVEDLTDLNTRAVVFDNEIDVKIQQTSERTSVMGEISRIQLFTCLYNPTEREATMNEIVSPFSVSVMGGITQGEGTRLQVEITDVKLHVNAAAIHLLASISSGMASDPARPEEVAPAAPDLGRLWDTRDVHSFNFWYLQPEMAEEAREDPLTAAAGGAAPAAAATQTEQLIFKARVIKVTVEQVVGLRSVPLVLLDAGFEAQVQDWSSKLLLESTLTVELGYYNSKLAVWEPIVECVERRQDGMVSFSPWALQMKVERNDDTTEVTSPLSPSSVTSEGELISFQPPVMSVHVSSKDPLEVTVTRTCLDVLTELQESLVGALELSAPVQPETDAHFLVRNALEHAAVVVTEGKYTVSGEDPAEVVLEQGAEVPLMCVGRPPGPASAGADAQRTIHLKIPSLSWEGSVPVGRADSRYFRIAKPGVEACGIVMDIRAHFDSKVITIRSCVQVENHQSVPVRVYYMNAGGNELQCVGVVEPETVLPLPFAAVYSPTAELFFGVDGYTVTVSPFVWRELENNPSASHLLRCGSKSSVDGHPFCMLCHGDMRPVFFECSRAKTLVSRSFRIHLSPPAVLSNLLPIQLTYLRPGDLEPVVLAPGTTCQMPTAQPGDTVTLQLACYLDRNWTSVHQLEEEPDQLSVWTFTSADGEHRAELCLGMHTRLVNGSQHRSLYAPFWMINRTGKMLTYKRSSKTKEQQKSGESPGSNSAQSAGSDTSNLIYHPETMLEPLLFSFKPSSFFSKKKASVRVEDSEWSDKFSIDTVGSGGTVTCARHNGDYGISVQIALSSSGLTRLVYFLPSVVVANNAPYDIELHETTEQGAWITVPSNSCQAFWPLEHNKELRCRVAGSKEETTYFSYTSTNTCLLYLANNYGGLSVSVQVDEASTIITLDDYVDGMATVRVVNHTTDHDVAYRQKKYEQSSILSPGEVRLYTWERPAGERILSWSCGKEKGHLEELVKDGIDEFEGNSGQPLYWVSFLDGMQRTLLFTSDLAVATQAQNAVELERIDQEVSVEIEGIGLSLVNNITQTDVMYLGITSSGVIWETQKAHGKRFRAMTSLQCQQLEAAHQTYVNQAQLGATPLDKLNVDKMQVDFRNMQLLAPHRRYLRRTFQSGVWLQLRTSAHQRQIHAKLNRLQLDNQLRDAVFPVVLAPVPPPRSVAADSVPKPFVEMSVVERLAEHTLIKEYKYFKMLIQEFHVKLDQGFIGALMEVFSNDRLGSKTKELVENDIEVAKEELKKKVAIQSVREQRNFYDFLHFSPLKIHVSFSMTGTGGSGQGAGGGAVVSSGFIDLLLQSVGVTVTEIQDVVFKLAFFQREHQFLSQTELTSAVSAHYAGQAVKQLYVLVLGLDVIGNPFGLVVGLTDGVSDLFYEPVQGAIQGPGEFAEGLALGVTSLFSHAVGGTAGAVSRITGTLGKGIAALTLDQEYQQKRREALNRRPADFSAGIAQSGRGLVMGVVDGVTGVVRKPIEGAQEEGALGFVKGVGKGMVGLFTRPTSGVVDFASGSFDAVKRTLDHEEVVHLRPPRHFQADKVIRPYVRHEAEGAKMLQELEKGRYAPTDGYVAHAICRPDRRVVLLLTDQRVLLLNRNEIFGSWQVDWTYMWKELSGPPTITPKGLELRVPQAKKAFSLFSSHDGVKVVQITDPTSAEWMREKMIETMRQYNV